MAFNPRAREPLDPSRNFITVRAVQCNGVIIGPNQPFDRSSVSLRRLRQLYEQRYIAMMPRTPAPKLSLDKMADSDLRALLKKHGIIPRYGSKREKLLELADGIPA